MRIDDSGTRLVLEKIDDLRAGIVARADRVADVRPVEPGQDQPVGGNAELDQDVGAGLRVGGGGQAEARYVGKTIEQRAQQAIVGPEIMAPFGHAMRLVDGDQRQRRPLDHLAERIGGRPFGRGIEQVELAALQPSQRLLPIVVGRGQRCGANAEGFGGTDLVVHQRDQR